MSDPDKTDPNLSRYLRSEGRFDRLLAPVSASPWTLAAFLGWTVICVAFGFWCGLRP